MSKQKPAAEAAPQPEAAAPERSTRTQPVSKALILAFAGVVMIGLVYGLSRPARLEAEFFHALSNCGATLLPIRGTPEKNGLEDMHALVEFQSHRDSITRFLGYCETSPVLARNVFRRALDEGNRNARMVGLGASFYLAHSKHFTQEDWDRLLARLNPERESERDVRRCAQRAIADLILIKERPTKGALFATPAGYKENDSEAPTGRIDLREFNIEAGRFLQIRWTSPDYAWAWIQEHSKTGKWNDAMQRFIIE